MTLIFLLENCFNLQGRKQGSKLNVTGELTKTQLMNYVFLSIYFVNECQYANTRSRQLKHIAAEYKMMHPLSLDA